MARNWKKEGISRVIVPFWITGPQIGGSTAQKTTKFKQLQNVKNIPGNRNVTPEILLWSIFLVKMHGQTLK